MIFLKNTGGPSEWLHGTKYYYHQIGRPPHHQGRARPHQPRGKSARLAVGFNSLSVSGLLVALDVSWLLCEMDGGGCDYGAVGRGERWSVGWCDLVWVGWW